MFLVIFVFAKAYQVLSDDHIYFTFDIHISSFISMTSHVFLVWKFSPQSYRPKTFETVYMCVSIHNANTHEVLSDSDKYFTFDHPFTKV